jgi:hypothetical protein
VSDADGSGAVGQWQAAAQQLNQKPLQQEQWQLHKEQKIYCLCFNVAPLHHINLCLRLPPAVLSSTSIDGLQATSSNRAQQHCCFVMFIHDLPFSSSM